MGDKDIATLSQTDGSYTGGGIGAKFTDASGMLDTLEICGEAPAPPPTPDTVTLGIGGVGPEIGPSADVFEWTGSGWGTSRTPLPVVRDTHSYAAVSGTHYVIGGTDSNNNRVATVYIYDQAGDSWSQGTNAPEPIDAAASAVYDGKIYVAGGNQSSTIHDRTIYEYDPGADTWSTFGTALGTGVNGLLTAAAVDSNGILYVAGGYDGNGDVDIVQRIDLVNGGRKTALSMPSGARKYVNAEIVDGKLYCLEGSNRATDIYDISADSWTVGTTNPTAQSRGASFVDGTDIYVAGGYDGGMLNTVSKYDTGADSWSTSPPDLPEVRQLWDIS
jgi:N-acetylneuraminic acid mutarotase